MAFSAFTPIAVYPGDGSTTEFAIPDWFYDAADVQMFLVDASGTETSLVPGDDFTVSIISTEAVPPARRSGVCNTVLAPAAGTDVVVFIWPGVDQDQPYEGRPVTPRQRERVVDRLAMKDAALRELFSRGFRSPINTAPGLRYIAVGAPGTVPVYDADGNLIQGPNENVFDLANDLIAQAEVPIFSTITSMSSRPIPDGMTRIYVSGYSSVGDGVGGMFIDQPNGKPIEFTTASGDGATARNWYRAEDIDDTRVIPGSRLSNRITDWVSLTDFGAVGDWDIDAWTGTDNAAAWAAAVAYCGENGAWLDIPPGNFGGISAFGDIPDPALHNVPEVDYPNIVIRGRGKSISRLIAKRGTISPGPSGPMTRPMLKLTGGGQFTISDLTLDGGFRDGAGTGTGSGAYPDAAAMIEVVEGDGVRFENVALTGFVQTWDTRTPDNGNYGRRGPVLLNGCSHFLFDVDVVGPTFREGPFLHNCRDGRFEIDYIGFDASLGSLSSPLNCFGPETYNVTGRIRTRGRWTGSALNLGGEGKFRVEADILGSIGTENTTASNPFQTGDNDTYGKGVDVGDELSSPFSSHPKMDDVVVTGKIRNCLHYNFRADRATTNGGRLDLSGLVVDGGFIGLLISNWDDLKFDTTVDNILKYVVESSTNGMGISLADIGMMRGKIYQDGSKEAVYTYPNASPANSDTTPRISRYGIVASRVNGVLELISRDFSESHFFYTISAGEDSTYTLDLDARLMTDKYPTHTGARDFIQIGTSSAGQLKALRLRGAIDTVSLVGHAEVTTFADASNIA